MLSAMAKQRPRDPADPSTDKAAKDNTSERSGKSNWTALTIRKSGKSNWPKAQAFPSRVITENVVRLDYEPPVKRATRGTQTTIAGVHSKPTFSVEEGLTSLQVF